LDQHDPEADGIPIHWARSYDLGTQLLLFGRSRKFRQKLLDLALLKSGEGFLDVGCGPGRLVLAACHRVGPLGIACGADISPQMIKLARRKAVKSCPAAEFVQAPGQSLPFDTGYFDAVATVFVVHHLRGDHEKVRAFEEMRRVTRKKGRVLIVDFKAGGGSGPFARHMADGDINRYPYLLKEAGFGEVDTGELMMGMVRFVRAYAD